MDLRKFYLENVKENDYHYRFYESVKNANVEYNVFYGEHEIEDCSFEIFDAEEAIIKFKELCQPNVSFSKDNLCWFYIISFYLHKLGYIIEEFPRVLARPPVQPEDFTYNEIRDRLITEGKDSNGIVRYATRRTFVSSFTFKQKNINVDIDDSINQKFIEISNRQASFVNMSIDEQLSEIVNLIENYLKKDGKYKELDYSKICFNYITNDDIISFRKQLQCFRHSSEKSIIERNSYSAEQKKFFVNYGLTIINVINSLIKI